MIDSSKLQTIVHGYRLACILTQTEPTQAGLASLLGISDVTIHNVRIGRYNGHNYGDRPHITRCIANNDFEVIRGLFNERGG